jgi:phosphatidylserine/phosphatidylglycerophosphate/cardiolipin synthase-like enzyme
MREELTTGTRIELELDAKERPMHCHHEKLVLVDDRVAYVGGIDLTTFAGNRLDSSDHRSRVGLGWHDACLRIEGPCAADVAEHFRLRWPRPLARPHAHESDGIEVQIVRTVPERIYGGLRNGEFTILESYLRAIRSAERFVYLESQFLWAPEVVRCLVDKLHEPPGDDFRVVVLVPARANNGQDDTRGQIGVLIDADREGRGGGDRFLACTLYQAGENAAPVYVHAKIGIVDDRWLTVGSANLNSHRGERGRSGRDVRARCAPATVVGALRARGVGRPRGVVGATGTQGAKARRGLPPLTRAPRPAQRPRRRRVVLAPRSARALRR